MSNISIIVILNDNNYISLIKYNYQLLKNNNSELIIVDIGDIDNSQYFTDDDENYYHLSLSDRDRYINKIIENKEQNKENIQLKYLKKLHDLPSGFVRDYAVGMTNNDIIFHMNCDCIYTKNTIEKKLKYLNKNVECVYCDTMLTYNLDTDKIGKTISPAKIYEGTMMHTKDFWKKGGFEWEVNQNEGRYFHYNKGIDRKQDNYYDCIQVIDCNNYMYYDIKELNLENHKIEIPEIIKNMKHNEINTLHKWISKLYNLGLSNKILGFQSNIVKSIQDYETVQIIDNIKQKNISSEILKYGNNFSIFFFNGKYPIWDIFEKVSFDIIFFETNKNYEQMESIILKCKKNEYIKIDQNIFFNSNFLK